MQPANISLVKLNPLLHQKPAYTVILPMKILSLINYPVMKIILLLPEGLAVMVLNLLR